ncbi:hypothetical protein ACM7UT_32615 [Pseudomonas aeruginosa]
MEQAMREEFEAWVWDIYEETLWFDMNREFVLKRNGDEYFGNFLNDRWEAWQASRAALKVELPPTITAEEVVEHFNIDEEGIDMAAGIAHMVNGAIWSCAAFIKQAGIEVKHGTA